MNNLVIRAEANMLKEQSKAPNFNLLGSDNKQHSLEEHKGKMVILYFYPKDDTPGCTKEACDFRDNLAELASKNCVVYGISKDPVESHQKFKDKYSLNFILLSDPKLTIHEAYYSVENGKVKRSTFLIDREGKIAKIWNNVKVDGHVAAVLKMIEDIQ